MRHLTLCTLLLACCLALASAAQCPAGTLPSAPVFPTAELSNPPTPSADNPLTTGHWSETANYAQYRPPAFVPVANPTQTGCPHQQSDVVTWSAAIGSVSANQDVTLPANTKVVICAGDVPADLVLGYVTVPSTSALIFSDAAISIQARGFDVQGALQAGSPTCRLRNKINITLWGSRSGLTAPAAPRVKGIAVTGSVDIHGNQYYPTWTRLAMTAKAGDDVVILQDMVNWQPGQRVVVATSQLKDARDYTENEVRSIVGVYKVTSLGASVSAVRLDAPLAYTHYGGREYQVEVALLSRDIVIQGDPQNSEPTDNKAVCSDKDVPNLRNPTTSTYPCADQFLTGYGGHVQVMTTATAGRFSGVELYRMGQTNFLGRYPLHYHNLGEKNPDAMFARDCSVHRSFFRCYVIHGTNNTLLTQNTAYDAIANCFYLSENGVEEGSTISYNFAAHVHVLGNPAKTSYTLSNGQSADGSGWYGQTLGWYTESSSLLIPADQSAAPFYFTNAHNNIVGNAASGGWTGFSFPTLLNPIADYRTVAGYNPAGRPFPADAPFRGNTAHSTGFWWASAGAFYFGGQLRYTDNTKTKLEYTAGRTDSHDTCSNSCSGSGLAGCDTGCWDRSEQLWLQLQDNKAFLTHRGLQAWGNRADIVRMEIHDAALSMNVFGQVWIDQLLMACRSSGWAPRWFANCPSAPSPPTDSPAWNLCSVRDWYFFNEINGFQWYDVGQRHLLTSSTFRNCRADWPGCVYGPSKGSCNAAVFTSLTHSDQFVPELMQITRNIRFDNCGLLRDYSTRSTNNPQNQTVSSRLQSWLDYDGSVSGIGRMTMLGSARARDWWNYDGSCAVADQAFECPLGASDGAASLVIEHDNYQPGSSTCGNGNGLPCPVIGTATHFGRDESTGLLVGKNAKLTGPIIWQSGGWFVRFTDGTPRTLVLDEIQVDPAKTLLLAFPYPSGTTFTIKYLAASWCGTSWANCEHPFRAASDLASVESGPGDLYYFADGVLYLRVVMQADTWPHTTNNVEQPWTSVWSSPETFTRDGLTLYLSPQSSISIVASCSSNPCNPQPNKAVPAARHSVATTSTAGGSTSSTQSSSTTKSQSTTQSSTTQSGATTTRTRTTTTTRSRTTTSGNSNGGSSGCFAASSLVRVQDELGRLVSKQLSALAVGDAVESFDDSGARVFSPVVYVAHAGDDTLVDVVELTTAAGAVRLTPHHLLLAAPNLLTAAELKPAGDVAVGEFLFRPSADGQRLSPARVTAVARDAEAVRNPLTMNNNVVVSDFACSTFAQSATLYSKLVWPLQQIYQAQPALMRPGSLLSSVVDAVVAVTDLFEQGVLYTVFKQSSN